MKIIAYLDRNKLGLYKYKIITTSVIITQERILHIKEHHPGDYEKYSKYIKEIIETPDYILKDNKNIDTLLYIKRIMKDNIQVVIRLNTNKLYLNKQNTIITMWKIKEKTYKQMIRNKEIIYYGLDKNE